MDKYFRNIVECEDCHVKYYKGPPGLKGREFHEFHELLLFIGGSTQLISKNIQLSLEAGSLVLIPKGHIHQMVVNDDENYIRCIIGFNDVGEIGTLAREIFDEVSVIVEPPEKVIFCFKELMEAFSRGYSEAEKKMLLRALLTMILIELKSFSTKPIRRFLTVSKITREALDYIEENLTGELSLKSIASVLNVSVSTLAHHFSSEMNISLYRYVSEKRIVNASSLIETGMAAAEAARESGFKDYAGFFKMYKKYYGKNPSCKKQTQLTDKRD